MNAPLPNENGSKSAFPAHDVHGELRDGDGFISTDFHGGLTKRELFAAMAMQGLAGAYSDGGNFHEQHVAKGAVLLADALLAALKDAT